MKNGLILAVLLFLAVPAVGDELSDYEKQGLHFCSTEGAVDEVAIEGNFYTIIFRDAAPAVFVQSELGPDLKVKTENLVSGAKIKVVCVHQAFRDDWQEIYDRDKRVWPKLVDIITDLNQVWVNKNPLQ